MKRDCSKTDVFLSEWTRMCVNIGECNECPMYNENSICDNAIKHLNDNIINISKDIVQKWSDQHTEYTMERCRMKTSELMNIVRNCSTNPGMEYCTNCCPFFEDDEDDENGYLCVNALLKAIINNHEKSRGDAE